MKKTNKILALVLVLAMLALAGCGGAGGDKTKIGTCKVTIDCTAILSDRENLKAEKADFVPQDGFILRQKEVDLFEGDTTFDVLKRACEENTCAGKCEYCKKNGIALDAEYNASFGSHYVKGIHQLYEKDCGEMSGWSCMIGGEMPDYSNGDPAVKDGDSVEFVFVTSWS